MTKDLVVLVADLDMEQTLTHLLQRHQALRIRAITVDIRRHPMRDSGCCKEAADFLRPFVQQYHHALVIFDHHGSGRDEDPVEIIQNEIEQQLVLTGWQDEKSARAVVIAPELESWVWSDSRQVDVCLGWKGKQPDLRTWLRSENLWADNAAKPSDPKRAMTEALKKVKKRHTALVFAELAKTVSWKNCEDASFLRLVDALQTWFVDG